MAVLSSDLIRQGAAGASTGYTIDNSYFNDAISRTYMTADTGGSFAGNKTFTYSGTNTFELEKIASVTPIQKLEVVVNDAVLQYEYDWTVSNFTLTISKSLNTGDIIQTTIKI